MNQGFFSESGWIVIEAHPKDPDEDPISIFHVMPTHDYAEHDVNFACWCSPYLDSKDTKTGDEVVVHRCAKENHH